MPAMHKPAPARISGGYFPMEDPKKATTIKMATYSLRFLKRVVRFNLRAFSRISFSVIWVCSTLCVRQTSPRSSGGSSFAMRPSRVKSASQYRLDPVDLGGHVARRKAGDLADRSCVQPFQV